MLLKGGERSARASRRRVGGEGEAGLWSGGKWVWQGAACAGKGERGLRTQVDTIDNVKGRIPGWFLLEEAERILSDMRRGHELAIERGELNPGAVFHAPKLSQSWLLRWRKHYRITWRT
eukprot:2554892-Alexandrium_andersonii.AAC.1